MTIKTEQAKREMYLALEIFKSNASGTTSSLRVHFDPFLMRTTQESFENALEFYLEAQRIEQAEAVSQLSAMRQERDDIQLRLHAIDYAYGQSQKELFEAKDVTRIAGDTIREQAAQLMTQAKTIGKLAKKLGKARRRLQEAREYVGVTVDQHLAEWKLGDTAGRFSTGVKVVTPNE